MVRRLLLVLVIACASCGSHGTGAVTSHPVDGRRIRYVVTPHPDDEFAAWSLVQPDDRSHYFVFISLGHGERSASCTGANFQPATGERAPLPQPFTGPGSAACGAERVDSFNAFLDGMAAVQPDLDIPGHPRTVTGDVRSGDESPRRCSPTGCTPARDFTLAVGHRTARLVFDLGDRDTTPGEVTWAIQTARRYRSDYPVHAEDDIVTGAYRNPSDTRSFIYDHPDQRAVADALFDVDQGVPGPQRGRTWPQDPRRSEAFRIQDRVWCAAMCVEPMPLEPQTRPDAKRTGVFQRVYGWLAFPGGSYWPGDEHPQRSFFSQTQDFWSRH